jgi:hypothetical protein
MKTADKTALEVVHRLLFRALIEMREQGRIEKNKVVFHLADLFHTTVLEMQNAAEGKATYEDALRLLEDKAKEKGLETWVRTTLKELDFSPPGTGG